MELPWLKINDFLLECGKERSPSELSRAVFEKVDRLIPFDQGRLYLLDENGKIVNDYYLGISRRAHEDYRYYSDLDMGVCSMKEVASKFRKCYPAVEQSLRNFDSYEDAVNFYTEYVRPNHIRSSFGLGLRDNFCSLRALISLDRTSNVFFSKADIEVMKVIRPHLDNLLQNLYVNANTTIEKKPVDTSLLTRREYEIAVLLLKGVTPQTIGKRFSISYTTVKKHIAHMHEKLGVSTMQELLVQLMKIL